ncbi:MAG: DUF429 domain-containing protein [Deltaproteobacteria bacterium]|nr:DUF429 domain-containing protein [Deltaproteobacteria bacterium]
MRYVVGLDGCRAGWYAVLLSPAGEVLGCDIVPEIRELLARRPAPAMIGIDIPVGLSEGPARACDQEARALLGRPRASSVFPAPIRPALKARSYRDALMLTRRRTGRGISRQAFGILPKVREVDHLMTPWRQDRMREVHPEVCFWALNGGRALRHGKRTAFGRRERLKLLRRRFPAEDFAGRLNRWPRRAVAVDDVLDAFVVAWTAAQVLRGRYERIPEQPLRDARGLRMEIVYPSRRAAAGPRPPRG